MWRIQRRKGREYHLGSRKFLIALNEKFLKVVTRSMLWKKNGGKEKFQTGFSTVSLL